jgi:hypothetical protein
MIERNLWGTDFDCFFGTWATSGPTYYVLARMHWDTDADVDTLLEEYYAAFGPMAGIVKEYFEYWEELTAKRLGPTPEVMVRAGAILDKSGPLLEKASPEEAERFRNILLGFRHSELMLKTRRPKENENRDALLAAAQDLMDLRHEIADRNVTNVHWLTLNDLQSRATYVREIRYEDESGESRPEKIETLGKERQKELLDELDEELLD